MEPKFESYTYKELLDVHKHIKYLPSSIYQATHNNLTKYKDKLGFD
jgi:hypothetical protein